MRCIGCDNIYLIYLPWKCCARLVMQKRTKYQANLKYTFVICNGIWLAIIINGSLFCFFCNTRFTPLRLNDQLNQSFCIENCNFAIKKLCNHLVQNSAMFQLNFHTDCFKRLSEYQRNFLLSKIWRYLKLAILELINQREI